MSCIFCYLIMMHDFLGTTGQRGDWALSHLSIIWHFLFNRTPCYPFPFPSPILSLTAPCFHLIGTNWGCYWGWWPKQLVAEWTPKGWPTVSIEPLATSSALCPGPTSIVSVTLSHTGLCFLHSTICWGASLCPTHTYPHCMPLVVWSKGCDAGVYGQCRQWLGHYAGVAAVPCPLLVGDFTR